jgi:hypothetical protein
MVTEEIYTDEKEIIKVILVLCSNGASGIIKDREYGFYVKLKDFKNGTILFSNVEPKGPHYTFDQFANKPMDAEITLGSNIYMFQCFPVGPKSMQLPGEIKSHPKRKATRIKIAGNSFISKMYSVLSVRVVDPSVQDQELSHKLHLIINTIESNLMRSENYKLAKITLFDGNEKSAMVKLIKKNKKPFVVFDTANFSIKDELVQTYDDYVKLLIEAGLNPNDIKLQLEKMKEFYQKNGIRSEAIVPLIFDEEVIGQIRVASDKESIAKANVLRLNNTALSAVDNLFTKCAFEITSSEPQTIMDLSVGGVKYMVTDPNLYKYLVLMKRIFVQLVFPDQSVIKTMATIYNLYPDTMEGYKIIGVKFSANMDWKDKQKLDDFIQSVVRLQNADVLA